MSATVREFDARDDDQYRHKYLIAIAVTLATVLEILDTSIGNDGADTVTVASASAYLWMVCARVSWGDGGGCGKWRQLRAWDPGHAAASCTCTGTACSLWKLFAGTVAGVHERVAADDLRRVLRLPRGRVHQPGARRPRRAR